MSVKRINDTTVEYDTSNLQAVVHTYDQYVTVYCDHNPMGTLIRRRHDEPGLEWTIYDIEGTLIGSSNWPSSCLIQLRRDLITK